jgi:hypothetical protein
MVFLFGRAMCRIEEDFLQQRILVDMHCSHSLVKTLRCMVAQR